MKPKRRCAHLSEILVSLPKLANRFPELFAN
jgi:hypothetical protein